MFTLPFTYPFTYFSFYNGGGVSKELPGRFDVALNGRPYMLDDAHQAFQSGIQTIPLLRNQADTSSEPGEHSINPEDLWPRAQDCWHHGAGQEFFDRDESDRDRYWRSLGIDPWTINQLKVLNRVRQAAAFTDADQYVVQVGDLTFYSHGPTLVWTGLVNESSNWLPIGIQLAETPQPIKSMATDGSSLYVALGSNGLHRVTNTNSTLVPSHYNDLTTTLLGYVKGRLMAANGNALYNVTSSGTAPSALYTHPNPSWTWTDFAEGTGFIYASGYAGVKTMVYKTAVKPDGTVLDVPSVAGQLPEGEVIRSMVGYLGFLVVGTDRGFRLATEDGSGNLTFGSLVDLGRAVYCFEPQERFVWFGYSNYDSNRTGLGRMDLSVQTATGVPAYATDLMAGDDTTAYQGTVRSVNTSTYLGTKRIFTVGGQGLFYEDTSAKVAHAWMESGKIEYGLTEEKVAIRLHLRHQPLPQYGSVQAFLETDDDSGYVLVGTSNVVNSTSPDSFRIGNIAGRTFQVRIEFNISQSTPQTPVVERYDLRAYPSARRGHTVLVPLLLYEKVVTGTGDEYSLNPKTEYEYIDGYVGAQRPVSYQELSQSFSAFVEEVNFQRRRPTDKRDWWEGTAVLKLKVLGD